MAVLAIRQRTGWLFMAVIVGHILLISAQVNTQRGVPLLEEVTFGSFAEVQRGATSAIATVRDNWTNYVALQDVRAENAKLKDEVAHAAGSPRSEVGRSAEDDGGVGNRRRRKP